jgi:hypothetical protein
MSENISKLDTNIYGCDIHNYAIYTYYQCYWVTCLTRCCYSGHIRDYMICIVVDICDYHGNYMF